MIALSPTSALMLYLCLTLGTVSLFWFLSHLKTKKKTIITSEQQLHVCEYCQTAYMAFTDKGVTKCPECQSFNKNNRY